MKCPKCNHKLPREDGRCLYCGNTVADPASAGAGNAGEQTGKTPPSGDGRGAHRGWEEPAGDDLLKDFPEAMRAAIAQIIQFSPREERRKQGTSRLVLTLVFLASASVTGFILWFLM